MRLLNAAVAAVAVLVFSSAVQAETKVTLSSVHLCCPGCVKGVEKAMKDFTKVKAKCDMGEKTIVLTGEDDGAVSEALVALAKAGFHGESDHETLKMAEPEVAEGKVARLELTGLHNCCGACKDSIVEAITSIDGVKANTVKGGSSDCVVEGDFDALALMKALYKAGFHCSVKE